MKYRQLGNSGLMVSVVSLGTMTFGGKGGYSVIGTTGVDEARDLIDLAVDAGLNLIDTADAYSAGMSEEILGEVLQGRRDGLLVATKARFPVGTGPNDAGLSRHHLVRACEASLRRLNTDYIDLYQVHNWDGRTRLEETLAALDDLVRSGKVRYTGCSNFSGWHVMKSLAVSECNRLERYSSMQIHYTLQAREAEQELLPIAIDQGLGILVWSPLAGGLLTGKYRRDTKPANGRHLDKDWHEPPIHDTERLYSIIDALVEVAERRSVAPSVVALAWLIHRPSVTSVIVGGRNSQQLASNLQAGSFELASDDLELLDRVSQEPLRYPYWHQAELARDRLSEADHAILGPFL